MTAMLIMGKYFSYLTTCAVSRAVMEVEKILYLMTAMLIMGKYFSYLTARAVSRAVMQVEKILSHLFGGEESTFLTPRPVVKDPQTGGESDFPTSSQLMHKMH